MVQAGSTVGIQRRDTWMWTRVVKFCSRALQAWGHVDKVLGMVIIKAHGWSVNSGNDWMNTKKGMVEKIISKDLEILVSRPGSATGQLHVVEEITSSLWL